MHKILYLMLILLLGTNISAQITGSVTGTVIDAKSRKPLTFATVTVFSSADTALIAYKLTNEQGKYIITSVPVNKPLRILITYSGFSAYRKNLLLTPENNAVNLDTAFLTPGYHNLEEVIVTAERPPVIYRNDTIEFNALSFKTLPTALVEDLLKKLPGVMVDNLGNVSVNGKAVTRILVDSREFFGGDPRIATRNLPANIIEKIQVTDDREQLELNPDLPEAMTGKVINLKLKKAIKKQAFGKLAAGAGTNNRYEGSGILNFFRDTMQVSILSFANNLNKAAFGYTDLRLLGGFRRSESPISVSSTNGYSLANISFGGTGDGIQSTSGGGINFNHNLKKGTVLNLQYFYGHLQNTIEDQYLQEQYLKDTILFTKRNAVNSVKTYNHRFSAILKEQPSKKVKLEFRPSFFLNKEKASANGSSGNSNLFTGELNRNFTRLKFSSNDFAYAHRFFLSVSGKKKGRITSISQLITTGNLLSEKYNSSVDSFFTNPVPAGQSTDRFRHRKYKNLSTSLQLNFIEPLNKKISLRLTNFTGYIQGRELLNTFDQNNATGAYDLFSDQLSNQLGRKQWDNKLSAGFNVRPKNWNITVLANYLKTSINDQFEKGLDNNRQYQYIQPSISISYKGFDLGYDASVAAPTLTTTMPLTDNSNPLFIIRGNPLLKPVVNKDLSLNYYHYHATRLLATNVRITSRTRNNAVVWTRTLLDNGVQESFPVNTKNIYDITFFLSADKQFNPGRHTRVNVKASYSYVYEKGVTIVNTYSGNVLANEMYPAFQVNVNWKDFVEYSCSFNGIIRNTRYTGDFFSPLAVKTLRAYNELIVRPFKMLTLESNITWQHISENTNSAANNVLLWNAELILLLLKEKKGQIKISAYDLLNRNIAVSRFIRENYVGERTVTILRRYIMLTFLYDLRGTNRSRSGSHERVLMF